MDMIQTYKSDFLAIFTQKNSQEGKVLTGSPLKDEKCL